ncbi:MAG: hypothetical protein ABW224_05480 [Kibdelosporangium sp.]
MPSQSTDRPSIQVTGDVSGHVVAGGHTIVINAAGSTVSVVRPGDQPRPERRDPIALLPRRGTVPIGRSDVLDRLIGLARPGDRTQVYGEPGIGKTTVLRRLAHLLAERGDPVVFLNGGGLDGDDLVQAVFEACFDSTGYRPSATERRRLMSGVPISLVIDDLAEPGEVLDAVPAACVVWSSTRRSPSIGGRSVHLGGLVEADGIALVERHLNKSLDANEIAMAKALCGVADGRPSSVIQALAATDGHASLPDAEDGLLRALIPRLDPLALQTLGLLHAVAPAPITFELLRAVLPASGAVDQLVRCGLVVSDEDGLRISLGATPDLPEPLRAGPNQIAYTVSNIAAWLATSPSAPEANAPAIARLIELALHGGYADLACQLARAAAPIAGAALRWGSWRTILSHGTAAAQQIRDHRALAYFAHEDRGRLLGLGKRVATPPAWPSQPAIPPQYAPTTPPPFPASGPAPAPWQIAGGRHMEVPTATHVSMPMAVKLAIIIAAVVLGGLSAYAVTNALVTDNPGEQGKTVCISTNMDDVATHTACARDAGNKAPANPPVPTG